MRRPSLRTALRALFDIERFGRYKAARWRLDAKHLGRPIPDGYHVQHCGHPTANFPYTGHTPDGDAIVAPNGRGFRHLDDALLALVRRAVDDLGAT